MNYDKCEYINIKTGNLQNTAVNNMHSFGETINNKTKVESVQIENILD